MIEMKVSHYLSVGNVNDYGEFEPKYEYDLEIDSANFILREDNHDVFNLLNQSIDCKIALVGFEISASLPIQLEGSSVLVDVCYFRKDGKHWKVCKNPFE